MSTAPALSGFPQTKCQLSGKVSDSFFLKAKRTELFTICLGLVFSVMTVVGEGRKIKV